MKLALKSEGALQKAIIDQWRTRGCPGSIVAAIPNGGFRQARNAKALKDQGVLSGFPDLFAAAKGKVILIELKKPYARARDPNRDLSDAQQSIIPMLRESGVEVYVANDLDAVIAILERHDVLKASR